MDLIIKTLRDRLSRIGSRKLNAVDFALICDAPRAETVVALGFLMAAGEVVLLDDGFFTAAPVIEGQRAG